MYTPFVQRYQTLKMNLELPQPFYYEKLLRQLPDPTASLLPISHARLCVGSFGMRRRGKVDSNTSMSSLLSFCAPLERLP